MTEVNVPLLRKAVEWAEAEWAKGPEKSEWHQNSYSINPRNINRIAYATSGGYIFKIIQVTKDTDCGTCYCIAGYVLSMMEDTFPAYALSSTAAKHLGLTENQADDLFDATNNIETVRTVAEKIAGERI